MKLLREAAMRRGSSRADHRVLRVARTLADLDGSDHVGRIHLAEACLTALSWTRCAGRRDITCLMHQVRSTTDSYELPLELIRFEHRLERFACALA